MAANAQYEAARLALKAAEQALADVYGPLIKDACDRHDRDAMSQLCFDIPEMSQCKRRFYHAWLAHFEIKE